MNNRLRNCIKYRLLLQWESNAVLIIKAPARDPHEATGSAGGDLLFFNVTK